jgi:hypothetical protein
MPDRIDVRSKRAQVYDRIKAQLDLRFDECSLIAAFSLSSEPFFERSEDHERQGNMIGFLAIQSCKHPFAGRHFISHLYFSL